MLKKFIFYFLIFLDTFTFSESYYENFEEAIEIHHHLLEAYKRFGYHLIDVPFDSVENRSKFILDSLNLQRIR